MKIKILIILCAVALIAYGIYFVGNMEANEINDSPEPEYNYEVITTEEGTTTRVYDEEGYLLMEETEGDRNYEYVER